MKLNKVLLLTHRLCWGQGQTTLQLSDTWLICLADLPASSCGCRSCMLSLTAKSAGSRLCCPPAGRPE